MTSLEECQGCGKEGIAGFCDDCEFHGVSKSSGLGVVGNTFAKATAIGLTKHEYTCQCTTCRIHKAMGSDGKPWKCNKPNSVGPGGFFCVQCMFEMSYNSALDKYTYEDETKPAIGDAAARMHRSKEGNVESFLADVTDVTNKSDDFIACQDLFNKYKRYCEYNNLKDTNFSEFGKQLSKLNLDRVRKTANHEQCWVYSGVKVKEAAA